MDTDNRKRQVPRVTSGKHPLVHALLKKRSDTIQDAPHHALSTVVQERPPIQHLSHEQAGGVWVPAEIVDDKFSEQIEPLPEPIGPHRSLGDEPSKRRQCSPDRLDIQSLLRHEMMKE